MQRCDVSPGRVMEIQFQLRVGLVCLWAIIAPSSPLHASAARPDDGTANKQPAREYTAKEHIISFESMRKWIYDSSVSGRSESSMDGQIPARMISRSQDETTVSRAAGALALTNTVHSYGAALRDGNPPAVRAGSTWRAVFPVDGKAYEWRVPEQKRPLTVGVDPKGAARRDLLLTLPKNFGPLFGFILESGGDTGDDLVDLLLSCPDLQIAPGTETVDGFQCARLSVKLKSGGKLSAWFSVQHPGVLLKWRLEKESTDLVRGKPLAESESFGHGPAISLSVECAIEIPQPPIRESKQSFAGARLTAVVPRGGRRVVRCNYADGTYSETTDIMEITGVRLDLEQADPVFAIQFPEGTPVVMSADEGGGVAFEWRENSVRPAFNKIKVSTLNSAIDQVREGRQRSVARPRQTAWRFAVASIVIIIALGAGAWALHRFQRSVVHK